MCCHTDQCCCGCTDQRTGIMIAGIIDVITFLVYGLLWILAKIPSNVIWSIIVIIADILLIIGASTKNSGCLTTWLVICMINIAFCFVAWIWAPIVLSDWGWYKSGDLVKEYLACGMTAMVYTLPFYYIYLWVVVKSFQSILSGTAHVVVPQQPIIRQANVVPQNQYPQQSPAYIVPLNQYPQQSPVFGGPVSQYPQPPPTYYV